jgi:hypothetical protein
MDGASFFGCRFWSKVLVGQGVMVHGVRAGNGVRKGCLLGWQQKQAWFSGRGLFQSAAMVSTMLLGAAMFFHCSVYVVRKWSLSLMLMSRDHLSILAALLGEAPPSSCVVASGAFPSTGKHVTDVLGVSGQSKRTAMLQSPQHQQR